MQQVTRFVTNRSETISPATAGPVKAAESLSDKDAGFCSGEETDLDTEFHSPSGSSGRDSIDTKDNSVDSYRSSRSKRKCVEPVRRPGEDKRRKLSEEFSISSVRSHPSDAKSLTSPFRPWSCEQTPKPKSPSSNSSNMTVHVPIPCGYVPSFYRPIAPSVQEEPLSLVVEKRSQPPSIGAAKVSPIVQPQDVVRLIKNQERPKKSPRILAPKIKPKSSEISILPDKKPSQQQKNYKNMTRERRIEANARERTRVHTISAAFETLRRSIPAYAHDQKLSKLSVLRIACSYIMTLSRVAGCDYTIDRSAPSVADCVDNVCSTIQLEGKARKKKDDN